MTLPTTTPISSPSAHIPSGGVPSSPSSVNGNISPQELKKRAGAGTREVHNKLEKNRRAHLKECFEMLRRQLPPCGHDDKKPSNLTVLHSAIRYIQTLRRKERDFEHEMERLAREKISFQQRLSSLKKEISSQCDTVDFSNLLPDVPAQALKSSQVHMGGSLSKPLPFDSDDDFEFDEEDETMQKPPSPQHSASTSTASERGHLSDVEDLSGGNSRPGSSRDGGSSPTMPVAAPATNPNALRPSAVVEHPGRSSNIGEVLREVVRKPSSPRTEPAPSPQNLGTKLSIQPQPAPIQLTQVSNKTFGFLQHVGEHISRQSHVQLVPTSHGFAGSGPTLVAPTAIQLVAAPSGLRMLATAPHPDQRSQVSRDDVSKVKMSTFITTTESSRLPGGAEINVISSSASQNVPVVRGNLPGKPINLSANASASLLSTTSAPPILNGSVISHGSALHRQTLPQGQNNTTVLSSGATAPLTHTVTHHLAPGQGIAHVVAASGQSHISTLGPLVAAPVTMVTPGSHSSGVHILATAKVNDQNAMTNHYRNHRVDSFRGGHATYGQNHSAQFYGYDTRLHPSYASHSVPLHHLHHPHHPHHPQTPAFINHRNLGALNHPRHLPYPANNFPLNLCVNRVPQNHPLYPQYLDSNNLNYLPHHLQMNNIYSHTTLQSYYDHQSQNYPNITHCEDD
ncbi:Hypothetical predicted protein [Cloeon dipterum]|nr:Hypothetical predicted protein [Cloeon dipterum]